MFVCIHIICADAITHLRTRLTLGSGDKGGEVGKTFNPHDAYHTVGKPRLPRQSDDGVTIHISPFQSHATATANIQITNIPKQKWAMQVKKKRKNSRSIAFPPHDQPACLQLSTKHQF
jgi:hypothetical protein